MTGGARPEMRGIFEAADDGFDAHLEVICSYLRQPSVSATGEGITACSEMTAELIEMAGGTAEIVPTDGHPVVLGRIEGSGPTLLRYGMYDVQPADEPRWEVDPFAAEIRPVPGVGPAVVARGAANSKACLAAFLCAIKVMRERGELPCTIVLMVDGEEELGSPSLPKVVAERRAELSADAAFDLDLHADRSGVPDVYLGCKGVLSIMLRCHGGDWGGPVGKALHSSNGVIVSNPGWSLVRALDALVGVGDELRFDLPVPAMPAADAPLIDALVTGFDGPHELAECNAAAFRYSDPRKLIEALVYEPVLNLNGLAGGAPQGSKTIIPHTVSAALDLRLPYGVDADAATRAVTETVRRAAPEVEVEVYEICPASKTSADSAVARAMIASHADAGAPARVWPSAPWWAPYYLFEQDLGLEFAQGGAGHSAGAHAANEYASIDGLRAHIKQSMSFVTRFAQEHSR